MGRDAAKCIAEHGVYDLGETRLVGHGEIKPFYSWSEGSGSRVSRHVENKMKVTLTGTDAARAVWIVSLITADGIPPIPSEPSIVLGEGADECARGVNGRRRFRTQIIQNLFADKISRPLPPKIPNSGQIIKGCRFPSAKPRIF